MQRALCPHCATELTNDGSLCGQVATCAACGGLFEMPPLIADPLMAVAEEHPAESDFDDLPRRRRSRDSGQAAFTLFAVVALVIVPLVLLVVGLILIVSGSFQVR
jgi:hypothetical protein